jgi:GT2 family glycosyltransferase
MTDPISSGVRVDIVIPTLGASPFLGECLAALRLAGPGVRLILVHQGSPPPPPRVEVDELIVLPAPVGFAAAVNVGMAVSTAELVGTVNDDAVVDPGWLAPLATLLAQEPRAGAAQGINRLPDGRVDGAGIAWNRWWQATQVGHGAPDATPVTAPPRRVFGVSATAALYRRAALAAVAPELPPVAAEDDVPVPLTAVFDTRLGAYYEDVELACRLAARGWQAFSVPAARALHHGSLTAGRDPRSLTTQVYGNRLPVVAALLGRRFWPVLPLLALRDGIDLARALSRAQVARAAGIVAGWRRAGGLLPAYARRGPARLPLAELARWRA